MMAARHMLAARAVVPDSHCIEGAGAFLSHYLPPEMTAGIMDAFKASDVGDETTTKARAVIGGNYNMASRYLPHPPVSTEKWNRTLDRYFVEAQTNRRMGFFYTRYLRPESGELEDAVKKGAPTTSSGHITAFVCDPETGTIAFFEPRKQGVAGDNCRFYVRHVDVMKYKAGPANRGDQDGNYKGLFGEHAILNTSSVEADHFSPLFSTKYGPGWKNNVMEIVMFDRHPEIYEGEAGA
jgi:hypothetical protein